MISLLGHDGVAADTAPKGQEMPFQHALRGFTLSSCWGGVRVRDGLELKTRSMFDLTMPAAMTRWLEFDVHVRVAINEGVTERTEAVVLAVRAEQP